MAAHLAPAPPRSGVECGPGIHFHLFLLAMIGTTLGHFRILEKLGAGGMGEIYRARDEQLQRDVALKVLPAGLLADENARKRFRQEALALSKLNHANIATVHAFGNQWVLDSNRRERKRLASFSVPPSSAG